MKGKRLKILIVDDSSSFRSAAAMFLTNELNCEIVGEAATGREFLKMIKNLDVDIVLMDIQMPDMDGISATKEWCLRYPHTKVLAITMFTDKAFLLQLIEAGFKGCVFKASFFSEILTAIEAIMDGKLYFEKDMPVS
ncbi:MAG TPA: response regulator transcription factor [Bacteroidales bacterium]|nr:response regulator transcription factor [Bacteroidales bacterium]